MPFLVAPLVYQQNPPLASHGQQLARTPRAGRPRFVFLQSLHEESLVSPAVISQSVKGPKEPVGRKAMLQTLATPSLARVAAYASGVFLTSSNGGCASLTLGSLPPTCSKKEAQVSTSGLFRARR